MNLTQEMRRLCDWEFKPMLRSIHHRSCSFVYTAVMKPLFNQTMV